MPHMGTECRKQRLLEHVHNTKQRMLRLYTLAGWSHKARYVSTSLLSAGRACAVMARIELWGGTVLVYFQQEACFGHTQRCGLLLCACPEHQLK